MSSYHSKIKIEDLITLIIPTHNRPEFIQRSLKYYSKIHFPIKIVIVDSSSSSNSKIILKVVKSFNGHMNISYEYFPSAHGTNLNSKITRAIKAIKTKYIVMCADKDFLILNGIAKCVEYLESNNDFSTAYGVSGTLWRAHFLLDNQNQKIIIKSKPKRENTHNDSLSRLKDQFQNSCPTIYSVRRRKDLFHIMPLAVSKDFGPRYTELLVTSLTVIQGKVKFINCLYHIRHNIPEIAGSKTKYKWNKELNEDAKKINYNKVLDCLSEEVAIKDTLSKSDIKLKVKEVLDIFMKRLLSSKIKRNGKSRFSITSVWVLIKRMIRVIRVIVTILYLSFFKFEYLIIFLKSPIKFFRKISYDILISDSMKKGASQSGNPLLFKKLLEFDSPHHSDFIPVYDILIRYPNGVKS